MNRIFFLFILTLLAHNINAKDKGYWINKPTPDALGIDDIDKGSTRWVILDSDTLFFDLESKNSPKEYANILHKRLQSLGVEDNGTIDIVMPNVTVLSDGYVVEDLKTPENGKKLFGLFSDCDALKSISLPKATYLGDFAFAGCSSLTRVDVSVDAKRGRATFSQCENYNDVRFGAQFIDRFLPMDDGTLSSDCWGAYNVTPRFVDNGIENCCTSFWGGNIVEGDDGKFHLFVACWPETISRPNGKSGHEIWYASDVAHAISSSVSGPYKIVDIIGKGHNPEIYQLKDGSYVIGVMGGKHYTAKRLYGKWTQGETTFDFIDGKQNTSNRTYIRRDDGSIYMMNKECVVFLADGETEHFVEQKVPKAMNRKNGSHEEDPVIWKDEVSYNLILNDCLGRVAYHFTSKDGLSKWHLEDGTAYTNLVATHKNGYVERWHKFERPKVVLDKYGRPTHMNFAAADTLKHCDVAGDNHSSKNIVLPLRTACRLELLEPFNLKSKTVKVKILAEDGFNPQKDINIESLRFGENRNVNYRGGAKAVEVANSGNGIIVEFKGETLLKSSDYRAKLMGNLNDGSPVWGYVRID